MPPVVAGWLFVVRSHPFEWGLGLLGLAAWLSWLVFSSRLVPAGLLGLLGVGAGLRWYAGRRIAGQTLALKWEWLALGLILLGAGLLRYVGLAQSLPYLDNPDEPTLTNAAIKMLQTGDLNPHFFRWPSLPFYIKFGVSLPQFLSGVVSGSYQQVGGIVPEGFYLAGRQVSALLGTATVGLVYLTGRKLYGPGVGLLAALILAVLPLHVEHSHYVTPDVQVTFFASLTLLMAAYIYKDGARRWYWWTGVAAGLTIGAKYNVGIVLLVVILAHFLRPARLPGAMRWLFQAVGLAVLTFLLTTPFAVLDLLGFLNELAFQVRHYTIVGHGSASEEASWSAYLSDFGQQGFVGPAAAVAGASLLFAFWRQRREDWLVVSLPVVGYFFFSAAKVHFARNLLPLLPPLAVLSAVFIIAVVNELAKRLAWLKDNQLRQTGLALVLWAATFLFCITGAFQLDHYYLQPDTRQQAAEWITANIPAGAQVRLEQDGPILPASRYKDAADQRPIGAHPPEWYRQQGFNYLIASSTTYEELSQSDPEAAANYQAVFAQFTLRQEFKADISQRPGPTIRIYQVK